MPMIWFEGQVSEGSVVPFDLRDRGLLLADGLFETMLVVGQVPFRLDDHLARLAAGAAMLRLPFDRPAVEGAVGDLARRFDRPGVLRVTVTRGTGARGLAMPEPQRPVIFAAIVPWSPSQAFRTQRLALSAVRRNESSVLSRVKSLAYLDNVLALDDAVAAGADDALLLSTRGTVACTSMANIFVLDRDGLSTPPVRDGALPGIMRALVMSLAEAHGLTPVERSMRLADLHQARAVFTTNSVRLISSVASLDGQAIGREGFSTITSLATALRAAMTRECGQELPQ